MFNRRSNHLRILAAAAVCCSVPAARMHGQTITGTINGVITDKSGAVLPNATIMAKNVATGVQTTATSNGAGE